MVFLPSGYTGTSLTASFKTGVKKYFKTYRRSCTRFHFSIQPEISITLGLPVVALFVFEVSLRNSISHSGKRLRTVKPDYASKHSREATEGRH